ncbi:MAG: ABC transporter permease [Oscillospiraceae bacterium]
MTENKTAVLYEGETLKKNSRFLAIWRQFRRNRLAVFGLCLAVVLVLVAIFANVIAPYDPNEISPDRLAMPSAAHLCGTDNLGRDLFSRILYGARVSLLISLMALVIGIVLGILLGASAGYFGGWYEQVIMRICDILMCIPGMLLAVCVSSLLGIGVVNTAIAIAVGGMAPAIRMIRATVMQIRSQEFVEAARATGSGHMKIIFHEILPNTLSPLIVDSTMRIGGNILQISGLSFIGLGVQPPTSEWGSIMSAGRQFITSFWPMITFPGIAILLTVFAFNVMGDGLRDALDPRLKQ